MEKHLSEIYDRAQKEVEKKTNDFFSAFEKKDEAMKKKLSDGKITQDSYDKWRKSELMTGEHWKEMKKTVAEEMLNANKTAAAYVNGKLPDVYTLNYNALEDQTSGLKGYSFQLVDAATVRNLATSDKTLLPYKVVNGRKDERWNTKVVNSEIMQGIIQGESIPNIAKRLQNVTEMNRAGAVRNARTTVTSAENKGRMDSYHEAEEMGIVMKKRWISTHDHRTREWHTALDGVEADIDKPFENEYGKIMYPGDPDADPANVYNCRCTLISDIKGFRGLSSGKINYLHGKGPKSTVVNGKDISETWHRRKDKFDFEINDVINAQGFDGTPQILSAEEFDKAVKEANDGNGFIAQRTYSAPDQETLDAYRNQLYHGDWYVDCSTGGAQYGQGMYCAADYTGTLSDGIKEEMEHYKSLGEDRYPKSVQEARDAYMQKQIDNADSELERVALKEKLFGNTTESEWNLYSTRTREQDRAFSKIADRIEEEARNIHGFDYTETFTLDPSAKVISYDDIFQMKASYPEKIRDQYKVAYLQEHASILGEDGIEFAKRNFGIDGYKYDWKRMNELYGNMSDEAKQIANAVSQISAPDEEVFKYNNMDLGAFAALNGYDAINAVGHGASTSYTVVLNRTKLIIKEPEK